MKLFTWLRGILPSPVPAVSPAFAPPSAARAAYPSGPLVPIPPLTPAERAARAQFREPYLVAAVAELQALAEAQPLPLEVPAAIRRLHFERKYLRADIVEAQGMGWAVDELQLRAELHRLEAEMSLRSWQYALLQRYGPELGAQLGQHEVAVGMRWEHVVLCYGQPPAGAVQRVAGYSNRWRVQYGPKATGSYFELVDDVVTVARLGLPPLAAHLIAALEVVPLA